MGLDRSSSRPLGSFERAQILTGEQYPYNLVVVVRLDVAPPTERLRAALDEVQRRTPMLRVGVEGAGRGLRFRLGEPGQMPLALERDEPRSWRRWVESELAEPFDAGRGPMARCLLVVPPGEQATSADLVVSFHHAIADAVGVARLVRDLLTLWAGGSLPAAQPAELPPSADERFPRRLRAAGGGPAGLGYLARQALDEWSYRRGRRRRPPPPPAFGARCRVLTASLSVDETAAFGRACRDRRVSQTAALEAAMLLAVVRRRYGGERLPQRYFVFPVFRPYLDPPIEPGTFASYVVALRRTLEVGGDDDLWTVAAAVARQIHAATAGDEKFLASIWSPLAMRAILRQKRHRMGTTALSFVGPFHLEVSYPLEPLAVSRVHTFVSNIALGPEYTAQARIFRRRLMWDVGYLDGDMSEEEAVEIAREMSRLTAAG